LNSDETVGNFAEADQFVDGRFDDLRGNGEAHTGERSGAGDEERVDTNQLAVRVDERTARVAGIDGGVGLNELAGLAAITGVGIGAVERADDAARDRELESVGIAEGEDGLSGMQIRGVAPRNAGEIAAADLDDGEIGKGIGADELGGHDLLVAHGDADVGRALDDVVVGDDVSSGDMMTPLPRPCSTRFCGCIWKWN